MRDVVPRGLWDTLAKNEDSGEKMESMQYTKANCIPRKFYLKSKSSLASVYNLRPGETAKPSASIGDIDLPNLLFIASRAGSSLSGGGRSCLPAEVCVGVNSDRAIFFIILQFLP